MPALRFLPRLLASGAVALVACADLPAGWESALPVENLRQAACNTDTDTGGYAETVALAGGDPVAVSWDAAMFRCAQDVEGFYRVDGELLELLVQPVDMHPTTVAKCDCLYDLDFEVPEPAPAAFQAWRRWDDINDPNDPMLVWDSEVDG